VGVFRVSKLTHPPYTRKVIRLRSVAMVVPRRADPPLNFRIVFGRRRLRGSISPAAVDSIAAAIQNQEGYYPGSLAWQNNNPGNLVYAGQPGASKGAGGFASFSSYDAGQQALKNQITLDAVRGTDINGNPINTVSDLVGSWAPSSAGNNTAAYISSVTAQTGYDPNAPLSSLDDSGSGGLVDSSLVPGSLDLSALSAGVDLSGVGLSAAVPVWGLIAAGLGLVLVLNR
jgi:hypothetical protein